MPPRLRLLQLTAAALFALWALSGCRKEVPPPPGPDELPKPKVASSSPYAMDTVYVRLGQ